MRSIGRASAAPARPIAQLKRQNISGLTPTTQNVRLTNRTQVGAWVLAGVALALILTGLPCLLTWSGLRYPILSTDRPAVSSAAAPMRRRASSLSPRRRSAHPIWPCRTAGWIRPVLVRRMAALITYSGDRRVKPVEAHSTRLAGTASRAIRAAAGGQCSSRRVSNGPAPRADVGHSDTCHGRARRKGQRRYAGGSRPRRGHHQPRQVTRGKPTMPAAHLLSRVMLVSDQPFATGGAMVSDPRPRCGHVASWGGRSIARRWPYGKAEPHREAGVT